MKLFSALFLAASLGFAAIASAQDARPFPDLDPSTVRVLVHVKNESNGTLVPGRMVYLVRNEGRITGDTRPFSYFEGEETNTEGTATLSGPLMPGYWTVEVYGGLLFDNASAALTIRPGESSYEVALPLKPSSGRYTSRDLPLTPPGQRQLFIRVQGRMPNSTIVPVRYASIYRIGSDRSVVMTGYDGTAVVFENVPLGETYSLRAEATRWEPATASFIAGASESGSRLTRADDYINFLLNSNEPPGRHDVSIRVQGRSAAGALVPVHYAMIYDAQGHEVVMTGYDGTAVAKVFDLPVGDSYVLHAEANHWKPASEPVTVGAAQSGRLTSGNDHVAFVLEPEGGAEAAPLTVEVLDHGSDKAIAGATVTLYKPNHFPKTTIGRGTTNSSGEVAFTAEEIASAKLQGEARVGAAEAGYNPNVQTVSASHLANGETRYVLYLRQKPSGFDLSGQWVFIWTWSVTSVDFIGTVSGGPSAFTFTGKVLGGGNAIWTAREGTATCSLNATKRSAASMMCSATFPTGSWSGQTAGGSFSVMSYGHGKKFDYQGRNGKGTTTSTTATPGPPAGIDLFELKPKS
jgi:hypothetical protein